MPFYIRKLFPSHGSECTSSVSVLYYNIEMKVLLVGQGGREHALAWKLSTSPSVEHVYVVPGNPGTETLAKTSNITNVAANDYPALVTLSKELSIGLVVAGPDDVVCDGIEGYFRDSSSPSSFPYPPLFC
jgi:phosphoribosylamine--glycine ligase/phosphoribosylformylglycinamidine cyclo-ligase